MRFGSIIVCLLFVSGCKTTSASHAQSVEDITSMSQQNGNFVITCNNGPTQTIPVREFRNTSPDAICPVGGVLPEEQVMLYVGSDCRQEQFVGQISPASICSGSSNQTVGSVKIGNQCLPLIAGLSSQAACEAFKGGGRGVRLHGISSCTGNSVMASVNRRSDCAAVGKNAPNYYVAAIQTNSACIGVPDRQLVAQAACEAYKGFDSRGRELYSSQTCTGNSLIANVSDDTDCAVMNASSPNYNIAGVGFGSGCEKLASEMEKQKACEAFKASGDILLFNNDGCRPTGLLATINETSSCDRVGAAALNYYVASVKRQGQCLKLAPQYLVKAACEVLKSESPSVELYNNNTCPQGSLIATVGKNSECSTMEANAPGYSVAGVKLGNGTCYALPQYLPVGGGCLITRAASKGGTLFFNDAKCSSRGYLGAVDHSTNCAQFVATATRYYVAGVMINGQCQGLAQQLEMDKACAQFSSGQ